MKEDQKFTYDFVKLAPSLQVPMHQQPSWELSYVILGRGQRIIGEESADFSVGDLVLLPPGLRHVWYFNSDYTDSDGNISNITIMFNDSLLNGLKALMPCLSNSIDRLVKSSSALTFSPETRDKISLLMRQMRPMDEFHRSKAVMDILFVILESLDKTQQVGHINKYDETQERLIQIKILVTCHYMRPISTGEMASHLGLNKSSFCTFFKKCTGTTFINYLNDFRLEQAMHLLGDKSRKRNISDICFEVGFQSVPHFNHLFKKKFGCSPREVLS